MKAFIAACAVFALLLGVTVTNDIYCHKVCENIERDVESGTAEGAESALKTFDRNELLLKISVDNGYITEAKVSIESLISAYECNDEYEISRYINDISIRVDRIQRALFI